MKRTKIITLAAVVLGLGVAIVAAMLVLRRPADEPGPTPPIFVERPIPAPSPDVAARQARMAPKDARAQAQLGDAMLAARRFDEAQRAYEASLAIDPRQAQVWSALGEVFMQTTRSTDTKLPPAAAQAFRKAIALDPANARARFYFAMEKDFQGQHDEAIGEWLVLLRQVPMGSDADEAIRSALATSVKRNVALIRQAVDEAGRAQPRYRQTPAR